MIPKTFPLGETQIPSVGFGTYLIKNVEAQDAVSSALRAGYRHIDTAEIYKNEKGVGAALSSHLRDNARDSIFVTTKLWPGNPKWGKPAKTYESTVASCEKSLTSLGLDHIDLYLIHAPLDPSQRLEQWRALVDLKQQGKTRCIGVSNYGEKHIDEIRAAGLPLPEANQIELHPWSQKSELVSYLKANKILPIAYSSLVPLSTWRIAEGQRSAKTKKMVKDGEDSPFKKMGQKYGVSEAQVLLQWALNQGFAILPKSTKAARIKTNIDLFDFQIDDDDMKLISTMNRGQGVAWSKGDPTLLD